LQHDLSDLNEQNNTLHQELAQLAAKQEQISAEKNQTIERLEQELANEKEKQIATENNLTQEKALLFIQRQNSQALQEINANLTQKLHESEQNHTNLTNAYQIVLKDKERAEKQANYYEAQLKSIVKSIYQ